MTESDQVVTCMPAKAIGHGRERVGSVSHERDLFWPRAQHSGKKLTRAFLNCEPLAKVYRAVFRHVRELRLDGIDGWRGRRGNGRVV